jgi:phospholipase C
MKRLLKFVSQLAAVLILGGAIVGTASAASLTPTQTQGNVTGFSTTTPIQHLVVIFDENVSFDHYFGTYPNAQNPSGEPSFTARPNTPSVNGLTGALLTNNPNAANPQRLDRSQALTCDQDHRYTDEQKAFDHGLMDQFVQTMIVLQGPRDPSPARTSATC